MTTAPRRPTRCAIGCWAVLTLAGFAWAGSPAGATETAETKKAETGKPSAAGAPKATGAATAAEMVGTLSRLFQLVADAGLPLEGLIKPERMEVELKNRICDNETELLSGNRTSLFSGNSARATFSLLSGLRLQLNITIEKEKNSAPKTTSTATALDTDANEQLGFEDYARIKEGKETGKLRKRFRALDKDGDGVLTPDEFRSGGAKRAAKRVK